jgi:5-methylcytosine-specific restriction enzyme A
MPTINRPKKNRNEENGTKRNERRKIYASTRWKKLRLLFLQHNPCCEECLNFEIVKPTTQIHHIISFMSTNDPIERDILAFSYDNLQALCDECHQLKHLPRK